MKLDLYSHSKGDHRPEISEDELSDQEVLNEIARLKEEMKDQVVVLGHHYQNDDIIRFADITGDSLGLSREAAKLDKPFVIFCGVHFMAETADILTKADQTVLLPDLHAGCSMADMAVLRDVNKAWDYIQDAVGRETKIVPVTYVNCAADLKAFVGEKGGTICTSSNAQKVIEWAFTQGEKLLFFPDQHLGRNTCFKMGVPLDEMVLYDPKFQYGGLTPEKVRKAKVILWAGHCSVHQGFTRAQIEQVKAADKNTTVIVHPECSFDVVAYSDLNGSTSFIIDTIAKAPAGSSFAVGTEINLVNRLAHQYPDKKIFSLSPFQCLCTTMYRVRPRWLLQSFRSIKEGSPVHIIKVAEEIRAKSLLALDRMLRISK